MKLYYSKGACSLAIRIIIHELNVPCEFEAVNLQTHQTESGKDFYSINPKGAVATLVLDDGAVLTENSAIMQYLADNYDASKRLLPTAGMPRYRVLEWLNYVATEVHKGCSPFFNPHIPAQLKTEIFKPLLLKKLDFLDKHFAHNDYLSGATLSLPDCYLFVVLRWLPSLGVPRADFTHVEAFFKRMQTLPSVQKSLQEEGLTP